MAKHSGGLELTWTDKDKAILSIGDGKYDYAFVQRSDYRVSEVRLLNFVERVSGTASIDRALGLPAPTNNNLLITGDAMHVLDALTKIPEYAEHYLGNVRLVYIDPPFNTGKAFSQYEDSITHSIWLTLLRDRLRQIRPLLAANGSIWVHLDDVEVHRCRAVMDEELGPENFVATVIWGKADTSRNDARQFSTDQDYLLVYSNREGWRPNRLPRRASQDAIYSSSDGDPRPWLAKPGHAPGAKTHQGMVYAVQSPLTGELLYPPASGCWRLGEDRMWAALNEWAPYKRVPIDDVEKRASICDIPVDRMRDAYAMLLDVDLQTANELATVKQAGVLPELYFIKDGSLIQVKGYKPEGVVPRTFWPFQVVGSNRNSKAETKRLFPGITPFDTPKPERLLQRIISLATDPGDIVLDCFGGSGTTAAVAHKMGRRWVIGELLPELVETYIKPRLTRVVTGDDLVGVTTSSQRVAADGVILPSGISPDDAQKFQQVLRKVMRLPDEPEDELGPEDGNLDGDLNVVSESDGLVVEPPSPLTISLIPEMQQALTRAHKAGTSPFDGEELKAFRTLLRKMGEPEQFTLDVTKAIRTAVLKRTNTRSHVTKLWYGGGDFAHFEVGPSMFEEIDGVIVLADWATQSELTKVMCAQLGVRYEPNGIFAAVKGKIRYVVIDGLVGEGTIASILDQVPASDIVQVWATQVDDDAAAKLRRERRGSRLEAIPDSVLDSYRRKSSKASPFTKERSTVVLPARDPKVGV